MTDFDGLPEVARVCAVCGRVLSYWPDRGWGHAIVEQRINDHPAVPVDPTDVPFIGRCDFCQADHPGRVIPCRPFALDILPGHGSSSDWAACDICAKLVDANRWSTLFNRARGAFERESGGPIPPEVEVAVRLLYTQVRSNITGRSRPID